MGCTFCGREIKQPKAGQRFCKATCRQAAWRGTIRNPFLFRYTPLSAWIEGRFCAYARHQRGGHCCWYVSLARVGPAK